MKNIFIAATYEPALHLFHSDTGEKAAQYKLYATQINKMIVDPDGMLFAASHSQILRFNLPKNDPKAQILGKHDGNVTDIFCSANKILTCGEDKFIRIWDRSTWQLNFQIQTDRKLNSVFPAPTGSPVCVCGAEDGSITLWDIKSQSCIHTKTYNSPIRSLSVAPNREFFLACFQDGTSKVMTFQNSEVVESFSVNSHSDIQIRGVISPDSKLFATCCSDYTVRIFDSTTGQLRQTLIAGEGREWIFDAAFSQDSSKLFVGGSDKVCRMWNVEYGRVEMSFPELPTCVSAVCLYKT